MDIQDPQLLTTCLLLPGSACLKKGEHSLWASTMLSAILKTPLKGKCYTCFVNKEAEALRHESDLFKITQAGM